MNIGVFESLQAPWRTPDGEKRTGTIPPRTRLANRTDILAPVFGAMAGGNRSSRSPPRSATVGSEAASGGRRGAGPSSPAAPRRSIPWPHSTPPEARGRGSRGSPRPRRRTSAAKAPGRWGKPATPVAVERLQDFSPGLRDLISTSVSLPGHPRKTGAGGTGNRSLAPNLAPTMPGRKGFHRTPPDVPGISTIGKHMLNEGCRTSSDGVGFNDGRGERI